MCLIHSMCSPSSWCGMKNRLLETVKSYKTTERKKTNSSRSSSMHTHKCIGHPCRVYWFLWQNQQKNRSRISMPFDKAIDQITTTHTHTRARTHKYIIVKRPYNSFIALYWQISTRFTWGFRWFLGTFNFLRCIMCTFSVCFIFCSNRSGRLNSNSIGCQTVIFLIDSHTFVFIQKCNDTTSNQHHTKKNRQIYPYKMFVKKYYCALFVLSFHKTFRIEWEWEISRYDLVVVL